jgi:hypothetical protein
MTHATDILGAPAKVHTNLLRRVQGDDLANIMEQRCDYEFISSPYVRGEIPYRKSNLMELIPDLRA